MVFYKHFNLSWGENTKNFKSQLNSRRLPKYFLNNLAIGRISLRLRSDWQIRPNKRWFSKRNYFSLSGVENTKYFKSQLNSRRSPKYFLNNLAIGRIGLRLPSDWQIRPNKRWFSKRNYFSLSGVENTKDFKSQLNSRRFPKYFLNNLAIGRVGLRLRSDWQTRPNKR